MVLRCWTALQPVYGLYRCLITPPNSSSYSNQYHLVAVGPVGMWSRRQPCPSYRQIRFHKIGINAADHIASSDNPYGSGEYGLNRRSITRFENIGDIARTCRPHGDLSLGRLDGVGNRGPFVVFHNDQFGSIRGAGARFRQYHGQGGRQVSGQPP